MSVVTDVVIHADQLDDEMLVAITKSLPFEGQDGARMQMLDHRIAGGWKAFEGHIFAGAFNYLNRDAMIIWFSELPWLYADCAVMTMFTEGEEFELVWIKDRVVKASRP